MDELRKTSSNRSIVPGMVLIFLGVYFLLQQLEIIDFGWIHVYPLLMLLIAGRNYHAFRSTGARNALFWASFFGLPGVFFLLRNFGLLPFWPIETVWPVFVLAAGIGFCALFWMQSRDVVDLFIGVIFFAGGILIFANNLLWPQLDLENFFWPVVLIVIGILLLRSSGTTQRQPHHPKTS